jgi:hypothetical protein
MVCRGAGVSDFCTWPVLRVKSVPPPWMTLELSPEPEPPCSATLSGV